MGTPAPDMKFCMDCGQKILRRAEICPRCGCRQLPPQTRVDGEALTPSVSSPSSFGKEKTSRILILLVLNALWSGAGNIVVGHKDGWHYVFFNILVFVLSLATFFIPSLVFFFYCCYQGYKYIERTP